MRSRGGAARSARPTSPRAPPALSPGRRRLYAAITLALPVVLLALLELGLRLARYGSSYPLFVAHPPRPGYLVANRDVGRRYFTGAFVPAPEVDFFAARKPAGTFRIVFQGESSAAGFPYGHGGAPSRMLEQRLRATFPDRNVEVVNTALTAVNSYTLLDLADEIVAQRPDAVMIYTGHNEYYGAFGAGSAKAVRSRGIIKAYLTLRRLRAVQLLGAALGTAFGAAARDPGGAAAPRTVMELMAGEQRIPFGSRRYEQGLAQFRANLRELLSRYRAHRIPVFIGTVASNERDQRPFVSGLAPGADSAAWWRRYRAGLAAVQRADTAAAERELAAAVRADGTAADAFYALGRLADARGDYARARAHYRAAKERDQLRFRAPEAINRIIREEAARQGATVVETQQALERASPAGIVGNTLMLEHLHPNIAGYFVIADAFYEALRQTRMIGPWAAPVPAERARREAPVTALDSLAGLFRADRLVSGWPFQPKGAARTPIVDTLRPRTPAEELARAVVLGTLPWPEATERLRAESERAGEYAEALRAARALAQEYRYAAAPYMDAARLAILQRGYDEALGYVRAAVAREETASSVQLAGLLLLRLGHHAAAMPYLRRAAQLDPADERMVIPLRAAAEVPALEQRRARAPRDTTVLYELAVAYALTQQYEKSREALAALRRVAPAHGGARELLRQLPPP